MVITSRASKHECQANPSENPFVPTKKFTRYVRSSQMLVRSGREKNLSSSSKHISRRSRERCNERRESSLGGQDSGKIPKPISLIRQKFPRLRWHERRKREREREEVWTSAKGGRRAQPRERIVMVHDAFRPSRSSIFIYSTWKYSASIRFEEKKRKRIFFEHLCHPFQTFCLCNLSLSPSLLVSCPPISSLDDEIPIERVARV